VTVEEPAGELGLPIAPEGGRLPAQPPAQGGKGGGGAAALPEHHQPGGGQGPVQMMGVQPQGTHLAGGQFHGGLLSGVKLGQKMSFCQNYGAFAGQRGRISPVVFDKKQARKPPNRLRRNNNASPVPRDAPGGRVRALTKNPFKNPA